MDYCIQGQGHSKGPKCWWLFSQMISSELQNILLPNLVWLCSIISLSVIQKDWFIVFNVKVTARADIIKIGRFLLYLLNCWSIYNQTWFDHTVSSARMSCEKNGITAFKVKVTGKVQNVSECLSRWYLLNHRLFCYQTWYDDTASWARVSCRTFFSFSFFLLLSLRSRLQPGLIWSKYYSF